MRLVIFYFSIFLLLSVTSASGQHSEPGIGKVSGTILEEEGMPIEFATVKIIRQEDSIFVTGLNTDESGNFQIESLPMGSFIARITFLGYDEINTPFTLSSSASEINLGIIKIVPEATVLKDIVVTAQRDDYVANIDKKVFE